MTHGLAMNIAIVVFVVSLFAPLALGFTGAAYSNWFLVLSVVVFAGVYEVLKRIFARD